MDVQAINRAASASPAEPPLAAETAARVAPATAPEEHAQERAISQFLGTDVSVQFKVVDHPTEIVTVFSDPHTGRVISEFPARTMVLIARFFNHVAGVAVDRSA